jgi:galactose mutarotase-like enzyme
MDDGNNHQYFILDHENQQVMLVDKETYYKWVDKHTIITHIHTSPKDLEIITRLVDKGKNVVVYETTVSEVGDPEDWSSYTRTKTLAEAMKAHEDAIDDVFKEKGWRGKQAELDKYMFKLRAWKDTRIKAEEEGN